MDHARIRADVPAKTLTRTLTVTGPDGQPLRNADVVVEQTRHVFGFGNIGFDFVGLANGETALDPDSPFGGADPDHAGGLVDRFFDVFNWVTLPFYWGGFEPVPGEPDTQRLLATARWVKARGATIKGHPLAWHTLAPRWLDDAPVDEVERRLRGRITREVTDFRGLIDMWDAINEVVIMPVFDKEPNGITRLCQVKGQVETVRLAFETAREANPDAFLLLNDFNMSPAYEHLIEECLGVGIRIDALGLQSHMHQGYWGEEKTLDVVERFSRFGLPLHMTETTLVSGHVMPPEIVDLNDYQIPEWPSTPEGEARQADEVRRHYSTLVAQEQVEAITYWGITDRGSWLGAPGGLVRADGTSKPAFDVLRGLVKGEWWLAPSRVRTDAEGRVRVSAFAGDFRLSAEAGAVASVAGPLEAAFTVTPEGEDLAVSLIPRV